ncbi:bifunctional diguanylate cyclase/phosphodiesterase [Comamonas antarctica]|uniref:EAL domain-containing protein n=1 Tax=Comamonas antarctica TaxID=2743470 RepID=A0A6N1X2A9_9BURK|nr:EAL domain-containing protein [Comamonas antarctica]QKV53549.1 EAL domain-containing protein [Comamonas antarctica]
MQKPVGSFFQALVRNVGKLVLAVGIAALAGTAWLAISHTREAAQRDLMQALDRSEERLRMLLEATEMTAASVERVARGAEFADGNAAGLRRVLEMSLSAFEQRPELSYLGVVLDRYGEYGTLERTAQGDILLWLHPGTRPDAVRIENFLLTDRGFEPHATQPVSGYDARQRPFYQAAQRRTQQGLWLPSYQWLLHTREGTPPWGLSYVKALRDAQGGLIGALDVDIDLPALNRFLRYLSSEYGVQLQIVEQGANPRLIGDLAVDAHPLAVPEALAAWLQRPGGAGARKLRSGDTEHWAASRTIELKGGLPWTVVATRQAPLIDGPLRTQLYQMAGMALAMALGLMLVAARMARRIGRPLAELAQSVERAGESGTADALVLAPSSGQYRETARLGEALVRMADALGLRETQLAAQTAALRQERNYADAVLNSLPGVFYHCDENARLQRWNRNLEQVTGMSAQQLEGMELTRLMPVDERERAAAKIAEVLETGMAHFEASYEMSDGTRVPCLFTGVGFSHEGVRGFVGLGSDISQRKRAERRLRHLATHDALTDLPNRHLLQDRLQRLIAQAQVSGKTVAVLLLDLDRFKLVNDAYGHPFGDEVIKAISARLVAALPEGHTVARHGGDEFLVLLDGLYDVSQAQAIAEGLIACIRPPLALQGREIHLSVSIGVSAYPQDGVDPETLIRNADQAMYRAKHGGRNTYAKFSPEMDERMQERVHLETLLRLAPAAGQLRLVYQPKVNLCSGEIIGCEALVRWHHPQLGLIPPGKFIPVAEESGLILPISDWVLRTACMQARAWSDAGLPRIPVAVNISAAQLLQQDLAQWALGMLAETGLAPELLELELTESLIAQDVERMIATFDQLKAAGVKLSIDDFGTGYSNLSHLKNFRVDTLKIDQSFVQNMLDKPDDATIVRAVITLAHNLRLKVIAEGVETAEHCRMLRAHGCDEIQGYYFSKPVSAQEFEAMVRQGRRLRLDDIEP